MNGVAAWLFLQGYEQLDSSKKPCAVILWMEEIRLTTSMYKWDILHINWCRISSISSIGGAIMVARDFPCMFLFLNGEQKLGTLSSPQNHRGVVGLSFSEGIGGGPPYGKSLYIILRGYVWVTKIPQEFCREHQLNTMSTLLGVHPPILPWSPCSS